MVECVMILSLILRNWPMTPFFVFLRVPTLCRVQLSYSLSIILARAVSIFARAVSILARAVSILARAVSILARTVSILG